MPLDAITAFVRIALCEWEKAPQALWLSQRYQGDAGSPKWAP